MRRRHCCPAGLYLPRFQHRLQRHDELGSVSADPFPCARYNVQLDVLIREMQDN